MKKVELVTSNLEQEEPYKSIIDKFDKSSDIYMLLRMFLEQTGVRRDVLEYLGTDENYLKLSDEMDTVYNFLDAKCEPKWYEILGKVNTLPHRRNIAFELQNCYKSVDPEKIMDIILTTSDSKDVLEKLYMFEQEERPKYEEGVEFVFSEDIQNEELSDESIHLTEVSEAAEEKTEELEEEISASKEESADVIIEESLPQNLTEDFQEDKEMDEQLDSLSDESQEGEESTLQDDKEESEMPNMEKQVIARSIESPKEPETDFYEKALSGLIQNTDIEEEKDDQRLEKAMTLIMGSITDKQRDKEKLKKQFNVISVQKEIIEKKDYEIQALKENVRELQLRLNETLASEKKYRSNYETLSSKLASISQANELLTVDRIEQWR